MDKWLTNFAYHIELGIGIFALSGALALFVALLTVGIQTFKAARSNPVDALRYE
jgi:putative ABC transport system permease protein